MAIIPGIVASQAGVDLSLLPSNLIYQTHNYFNSSYNLRGLARKGTAAHFIRVVGSPYGSHHATCNLPTSGSPQQVVLSNFSGSGGIDIILDNPSGLWVSQSNNNAMTFDLTNNFFWTYSWVVSEDLGYYFAPSGSVKTGKFFNNGTKLVCLRLTFFNTIEIDVYNVSTPYRVDTTISSPFNHYVLTMPNTANFFASDFDMTPDGLTLFLAGFDNDRDWNYIYEVSLGSAFNFSTYTFLYQSKLFQMARGSQSGPFIAYESAANDLIVLFSTPSTPFVERWTRS